jgi:hypothetical protein
VFIQNAATSTPGNDEPIKIMIMIKSEITTKPQTHCDSLVIWNWTIVASNIDTITHIGVFNPFNLHWIILKRHRVDVFELRLQEALDVRIE